MTALFSQIVIYNTQYLSINILSGSDYLLSLPIPSYSTQGSPAFATHPSGAPRPAESQVAGLKTITWT